MTDTPGSNVPAFVDNPHAPDVYADGATGWFFLNGNIRITLESVRASHSSEQGPTNRVVIGRIVMPVDAAELMSKKLLEFIESQRNQNQPPSQFAPTLQ
jgi:hypothetical protein